MESDGKPGNDEGTMTDELEELKEELETQTRLAEDRLNRLKYLQADFDNYRKWSQKEKEAIIALANENLIKDLLVILDDFDQALPSLEMEQNREGMQMVQKKMVKVLKEYGLQPIDDVGKKFDPQFHEVVYKVRSTDEANTILENLGKGYQLRSKVIRPSKVKIAEHITDGEGEING
ncbi:MAG: nucleotide exchange factor GrpE [Methanoregula sp.]|nr:nucleotide exchange factor GrpE [Methanoregula sp.]